MMTLINKVINNMINLFKFRLFRSFRLFRLEKSVVMMTVCEPAE